jgi:hypothetical protein
MKRLLGPALLFMAIALALYAALYVASEQLLRRNGHSNPLFKIDQLSETSVDWVVLGASHAMPLDFDDVNAGIERASGQRIVQLAGPGTGPLYNRFVFEHFLHRHNTRNLLYVVDAFAFYSRTWNEDRFSDAKLLRRTPWDAALAARLARYVRDEGVEVGALLDFASGFSKINNRERFERDVWEGETQFERAARPARGAIAKRIAYLYPDKTTPQALARYLRGFDTLLALARQQGVQVLVVKMPLPREFRQQLPDETAFEEGLAHVVAAHGARLADLSAAIDDSRSYFDTDHLNRAGLQAFIDRSLTPLLVQRVP